jgi:hypothetical protein
MAGKFEKIPCFSREAAWFRSGVRMVTLKVGDLAPDFELPGVLGERRQTFKLSDFRDRKNVVLVFYVLDWSPV